MFLVNTTATNKIEVIGNTLSNIVHQQGDILEQKCSDCSGFESSCVVITNLKKKKSYRYSHSQHSRKSFKHLVRQYTFFFFFLLLLANAQKM